MSNHQDKNRLTGRPAAVAALVLALAGAGMGSALAAPGDAASAPDAASVSYAAGSQYTVRPGQSLNDVAIAVTQSHDRATLARATHALFDANPNAFMSHDPSRMRVGAVLTIPALDASGALAASSTASTASAASSPAAQAAAGASATGTVAATEAASGAAQAHAAAASAASPASSAANSAAPAAPVMSQAASTPAEARAAPAGAAVSGAVSSAPIAGSQAAALSSASGGREWSGAIQPTASEPAAVAQPQAPATAGVQPASQPHAQVSSLQQLLALKNRVLMELQKHGIGGAPVATSGTASVGGSASVPAASPPKPAETAHASAAVVPVPNSPGMSQTGLSIAAAVGAALVVLLAALRMLRRKREAGGAAEAASADGRAASTPASDQQTLASRAARAHDGESAGEAAALAGEDRAAQDEPADERAAGESAVAERAAAQRVAEHAAAELAAAEKAAAEKAAAERAAAEQTAAEQTSPQQTAPERTSAEQSSADHTAAGAAAQQAMAEPAAGHEAPADSVNQDAASPKQSGHIPLASPVHAEPAQPSANAPQPAESASSSEALPAAPPETSEGATTAASLAAAAELGAEALPLEPLEPLQPLEPVDEPLQHDDPSRDRQWNDEPASSPPSPQQEPATERQGHPDTPAPVIDFAQQSTASRTLPPLGQPSDDAVSSTFPEPSTPAQPVSAAPSAFPRDAVDAFSSLDMPLPPRIDSPADTEHAATSAATQPAASPQDTAQHAITSQELDDSPHIADEMAAGTAGHAALAGLGARSFGSLNLDFDLELPPSPAPPLPVFTQTDLIRIARNKLDLASEYIELGDLSGARTLINEVIEADDPATRTEARALLSTLAPLS